MSSPTFSEQQQQSKSSIVITKLLACGKFPVYHACNSSAKVEYALKFFPQDQASLALFSQELRSLSILNHPNIIKYISHSRIQQNNAECNMLITEYAPFGDFYDLVMSRKLQTNERLVRNFFHQLIAGIEYLHSRHQIAHCDLKLENLLLGKDYLLKIADFDQARSPQDDITTLYATEGYRAPEVIDSTCQDIFAADIYSAGVLLYILITGEMPFAEFDYRGSKKLEGYEEFCEFNDIFWSKKAALYHEEHSTTLFSEEFRTLINGMLIKKPEERMTLEQIKESKWYQSQVYEKEEFEIVIKRAITRKD